MDFTTDDFLGGKVRLRQPVSGYRATSDAVLLAAAIEAKGTEKILDIGCGSGAVALCAAARCPDASVTGLELQPEMAALARENIALNQMGDRLSVTEADIRAKRIDGVPTGAFDWVATNPPFILENQPSPDKVRDTAHRESDCPLSDWIFNSLRYVNARGHFALINRADRLPEILSLLYGRLGGIRVIPIWTKEGEPAKRVVVVGRKGSKSPAVLETGVVLTDKNGQKTEKADAIMRFGASLSDKA